VVIWLLSGLTQWILVQNQLHLKFCHATKIYMLYTLEKLRNKSLLHCQLVLSCSVNLKLFQATANRQKEIYVAPGTKQEAHNEKARDNAWR
jgi:hypothetical protein